MTFVQAFAAERAVKPRKSRTPLMARIGRFAGRHLPRWQAVRTAVLSVSGFALLDVAAFQWHMIAGLCATGVSLLILEALGGEK